MERIVFRLKLRPGKHDEYKRIHDEIWPEMLEVLSQAGIQNYTIWRSGSDLFGYYEVKDSAYSDDILANSNVFAKWNELMESTCIDLDPDNGTGGKMQLMFGFGLID